jgi:hypothetical protein
MTYARTLAIVAAGFCAATSLSAQAVAQRLDRVRDGKVRLSYATRPEVCGNGHNINIRHANDDWEPDCEHGPARLQLTWQRGALVDVDTYVGGRWRASGDEVTDLGVVPATEAADYLLALATRVDGDQAEDLIFPATLADSATVWPRLAEIARDGSAREDVRKSAIFWLGQAAGDQAARTLGDIVDDTGENVEVQEHAVFALSQLNGSAGVPALLEVARSHRSVKVRRSAMFWLAQSKDPRAIALFEEILRQR